MNIRHLCLLASLFALAINGTAATAPSAPAKVKPSVKPAVVSADNPASALKEGMPAEVVRQTLGQPRKVTPMKAPDGKAEIWVYTRQVSDRVERVEIGSIPITTSSIGADGQAHTETIGQDIQYGDLHYSTEEIIELLMFNDHYVTCKTTRREIKHYN